MDNSALSIEWYLDGELLPWDQPQYEAKEGGTYYAILSNEVCTIQTESIEIQVQTPPDPTLVYEGTLACEGDSIPIIANNALDSWQWYLDGVPIESANGPQYWAHSSGEYSYTGTLGPCEISSEYVTISIVEAIVPTLSFLNDTLFAPPAAAYQWYFNGELLEGATGSFLVPPGERQIHGLDPRRKRLRSHFRALEVDLINSVSNRLPQGWKLYPNPATDWLVLEVPGVVDGVFALYDLRGRMVLEGVVGGGGRRLDVRGLGPGCMYWKFRRGKVGGG
ncbi:MAG: hypothetical protein IPH04_15845 [Saprospirales bacterium]|nr:hypothetical protein [Saprospirales bacterium]